MLVTAMRTTERIPQKTEPPRSFMPMRSARLQRKCACGGTPGPTGECEACRKKRLQRNSGDAKSRNQNDSSVPPIVHEVLRSPGQPLDGATRAFMNQRFGHDFSRVRIHSGGAAEQSAQDVNANAYTVGHKIVFGAAQFAPGTERGNRLLAHELAHVVQQGASTPAGEISIGSVDSPEEREADRAADQLVTFPKAGPLLATPGGVPTLRAAPAKKTAQKKAKPKIPKICSRASRKVAGNSITKVNLDVGANTLTIEWQDATKIPSGSAGTHAISAGAGLCCVDCDDAKVSQKSGSLCTPKGDTWTVDSVGCQLSGHPSAKNPTYFQRRTIAIHSGNTSSPPQSHGCSRTALEISELIHDNVIPDKTQIASSGTWAGTKCYMTEAATNLSNRTDVCDGNKLKSKKKNAKPTNKPKPNFGPNAPAEVPREQAPKPTQSSVPVAETLPEENDDLVTVAELEPDSAGQSEMIEDGPGPNNEPPSSETIGDEFISDLDSGEAETEEETAIA
jgi:hypothetical protein